MKAYRLLFLMSIVLATACQKETVNTIGPSHLETAIIGSWQVIADDGTPSVTEWGGFYVSTVTINSDHSFIIDLSNAGNSPKTGTWQLKDHNITFFTDLYVSSFHLKETTIFQVSIDASQRLVFLANSQKIIHSKVK
jgi:hypothetical protein